jgi:ribulose-phosphate 3-epimerase
VRAPATIPHIGVVQKRFKMSGRRLLVAPSLLACDFGHLAEEIRKVEEAGADWLHVDVMDGHFVPNLTIGPGVVEAIRRSSRTPLDVHLMLNHPEQYVKPFLDAGAHYLTVHVEAPGLGSEGVLQETLETVHRAGAKAGLSLRPRTAVESLKPFLGTLDLVLVMTVEPGFGGQAFMPETLLKVRQLREWFAGDIAVDGGINAQTGQRCREAGANVFVAGTYVFRSASYREAIQSLRGHA